jgi:hypothetical protein
VRAELVRQPGRFEELVDTYSEHPDAVVHGDLGEWSTWEPTDYAAQLLVLSHLAVGEISEPVETLFGWELLERTPERAREQLAMTAVEVPYTAAAGGLDGQADTGVSALDQITEFARILRDAPERFDELQQRGCCAYVAQWPDGRGWAPLMAVLKRLAVGQVAEAPVALGTSYVIPKRVPAQPAIELVSQFELPSPDEPDMAALFISSDVHFLEREFDAIAGDATRALGLSEKAAATLRRVQSAALGDSVAGSLERRAGLDHLRADLRLQLGDHGYDRYARIAGEHFKRLLLQPPARAQPEGRGAAL